LRYASSLGVGELYTFSWGRLRGYGWSPIPRHTIRISLLCLLTFLMLRLNLVELGSQS
jgi:hypothetical protein